MLYEPVSWFEALISSTKSNKSVGQRDRLNAHGVVFRILLGESRSWLENNLAGMEKSLELATKTKLVIILIHVILLLYFPTTQ